MNDYGSTDVLVALSHLALISRALDDAADETGPLYEKDPEQSPLLGLARIKLTDARKAASALDAWCDARTGGPLAEYQGFVRPDPGSSLDRVLWSLRTGYAFPNNGWTISVGKNRLVGHVIGMQNPAGGDSSVSGADAISYGGGGAPRAISNPEWATLAARTEDYRADGSGVSVGIVDTRIREHPFLTGAWLGRTSGASDDGGDVLAEGGHGTFVSGLILRRAAGATLQVRSILDDEGTTTDSWSAAKAIVEAGQTGIDILNLSFVSYTQDGQAPMVLAAAIDRLDPGIVVVAAAGNHGYLTNGGERSPAWPAALDDVIAVGSAGADSSEPAAFTPKGPWIDVLAPGIDVESCYLDGEVLVWRDTRPPARYAQRFAGYAQWSGTSFSAALVTGEIAARMAPGKSAREASEEMLEDARTRYAGPNGAGRPVYLPIRLD